MSGYYHDRVSFYIQRIGINPELEGKYLARGYAVQVWKRMKEEKHHYIMGIVENTNTPTLLIALRSGFKVHGFRVSTDGKQYVEIMKDLREKNNG